MLFQHSLNVFKQNIINTTISLPHICARSMTHLYKRKGVCENQVSKVGVTCHYIHTILCKKGKPFLYVYNIYIMLYKV